MLMKAGPLFAAVESVRRDVPRRRIILMGPAGSTFDQAKARELASYDQLILLCGHYEGVDYRVEQYLADETISIGDFVVTGGEMPAMIITDAVARMIPGVLGSAGSASDDSFYHSLLEYPQYTKPAVFRGHAVPEVLRNGDHAKIAAWRREQSLRRTAEKGRICFQAVLFRIQTARYWNAYRRKWNDEITTLYRARSLPDL